MKLLRMLILPVLLSLLVSSTALAYKPAPDIIRECSKCKAHLKCKESLKEQDTIFVSYKFIYVYFWTDGYGVSQLPFTPWLVKCPKCGNLLWIDEAKILEVVPWDEYKKWPNMVKPSFPSESDFLNLAKTGKLSHKKEMYVRRHAWWVVNRMNVANRVNAASAIGFSPEQEKNLQNLADLYDENDSIERIMKAEILRELGRFEDCIKLLKRPFDEDHHMKVAAFIRKLAEQKIRQVREITEQR